MFLKIIGHIPGVGLRYVDLDVTRICYIAERIDGNYDIYFGNINANIERVSQEYYDKIIILRNALERQDRMDSVLT
jgi:hypothetical protein